jgi:hypothetical protein
VESAKHCLQEAVKLDQAGERDRAAQRYIDGADHLLHAMSSECG